MLSPPDPFVVDDLTKVPLRRKSTSTPSSTPSTPWVHSLVASNEPSEDRHRHPVSSPPSVHNRRKLLSLRRSTSAVPVLQAQRVAEATQEEVVDIPYMETTGCPSAGSSTLEGQPDSASSTRSIASDQPDFLSHTTSTTSSGKSPFSGFQDSAPSAPSLKSELSDIEELREVSRRLRERESQFAKRHGKKVHRFPASEVPYPRSYDREVVDLDVWCMMWAHQLAGAIAMHGLTSVPDKILDVGCGTGSWILNAAIRLKSTHFVGLDVVPQFPDLEQVGCEFASRVSWVQANFLERLPFADEEFDFVYARRISRGVPEDKWDQLLEEFARVLKPGGAVQLSEEDLYFPGGPHDLPPPKDDSSPTEQSPSLESHSTSTTKQSIATTPLVPPLPTDSSPLSSVETASDKIPAAGPADNRGHVVFFSPRNPPVNPRDHSLLEHIYNEMHAARFINLGPLAIINNMLPLHFTGVRTHPPLLTMFPPPPRVASGTTPHSDDATSDVTLSQPARLQSPLPPAPVQQAAPTPKDETIAQRLRRLDLAPPASTPGSPSPFILVPQLVSGTARYARLDMERYTAYAPRSLFEPNRFQKPYPPPPPPPPPSHSPSSNSASGGAYPGMIDKEMGRDRLTIERIRYDLRTLNLQLALRVEEVLACSEAMWDFVVGYQKAHAVAVAEPPKTPSHAHGMRGRFSRQNSEAVTVPLAEPSPLKHAFASEDGDPVERMLMELTRPQFDALLSRFKFDMQDQMGLSSVLHDRLSWASVPPSRTDERKEFDVLCDAWARYQEDQRGGPAHGPRPSKARSSTASALHTSYSHSDSTESSRSGGDTLREGKSQGRPGLVSFARDGQAASTDSDADAHVIPAGHHTSAIPAYDRLARTVRTFVAYKA